MNHVNIEIKAKCENIAKIRNILLSHNADYEGVDNQIDTYFQAKHGRLKLREGNIENSLIHYHRDDQAAAKESIVTLYHSKDSASLKEILTKAIGTKIVVDKKREIYFIDNVKFHLDTVAKLGEFVEIEAIGNENNKTDLQKQCNYYINLFGIKADDLVSSSYSDMLEDL